MKSLITVIGSVLLFSAGVFGQSTTAARPRVAPTATPTIKNDSQLPAQQPSGPPVLRGGGVTPSTDSKSRSTAPAAKSDDENEVLKVETNLVTMPVSVLDRDGRFIAGLRQQDFKIFENGVEQKVGYFQSVEQPFTVILMLDVSPSTQWQIEDIQNAADTFVDQLRPDDKVMVMAFDERVHILSNVTNDRYQLHNAIHRTRFGDGTSLYEAVDHVLGQELSQIQGRKAVVLFTDGVDTTSRSADFESTVKEAEEADALFYTIRFDTSRDMNPYGMGGRRGGGRVGYPPGGQGGGGVTWGDILGSIIAGGGGGMPPSVYGRRGGGGAGNSPEEYETGKKYLNALAQETGGREFEADSLTNLSTAFSGIAEELRRQYSIGYYPDKVGQAGERRSISIRVNRPNVVVRAKNTYIVGQTNRTLAGK